MTTLDHHSDSCDERAISRRRAIGLTLSAGVAIALAGCAGGGSGSRPAASASPVWPPLNTPIRPPVAPPPHRPSPHLARPSPTPTPSIRGVLPRSAWAHGGPIPERMNPLGRIVRITVHHDGMPPVYLASRADVADRIDSIRRAHQNAGWGDIGYHFIVDPFGQVWEGRSLRYQGAHVKNQNQWNLGVLSLGNFEVQTPTRAQSASLERFLAGNLRRYRTPLSRLRTHRELAPTLCPGRNLQRVMNQLRSSAGALAHV